jgi:cellulose biosynthesis protein BcsQ
MKHPDTNYIILVPEQFTMQTQKELVLRHPRHGIMNIDVLSFARLAFRVLEETGNGSREILDDEGKNLILRRLAGKKEDSLKVLKGNIKKPGYISEVKSVISELTQYNISPDGMDDMITEADESSYLAWKLKDIQVMYQAFEEYLADKYITKEEILDILCNVMDKSRMLKDSVIALDGFTGFTPLQNKVLGEMLHHCQKVMITVTMDKREDPYVMKDKYQLFALSKQMVTSLVRIAVEKKVLVVDADPQANASSGLGVDIRNVELSIYECLVNGEDASGAITQTEVEGLDIIPSHIDLVGAEIEMLNLENRERILKQILTPLKEKYDFILIDCSPSLGLITVNALTAADSVIIPVQCEYFALEGISKLLNTIKIIKSKLNPALEIEGFLLTMYDSRLRLANQIYEEVKRPFRDLVFTTVIQRNVKLSEASSYGKPVLLYDADSKGSINHMQLAQEIVEKNKGLWQH